jgi:hypothetical protein
MNIDAGHLYEFTKNKLKINYQNNIESNENENKYKFILKHSINDNLNNTKKVPNYPPLTTFNKIHNRKFTVTSNISTISTTSNYSVSRIIPSESIHDVSLAAGYNNIIKKKEPKIHDTEINTTNRILREYSNMTTYNNDINNTNNSNTNNSNINNSNINNSNININKIINNTNKGFHGSLDKFYSSRNSKLIYKENKSMMNKISKRYTKSSSLDEIDLRRFQSNNEISNYYESTGDDQNKSQSKEKQEYYLSNSREQSTQSNFSNYSTHSNLSTNGKTSKLSLENQKSDDKNIKEFNEHIIQINDK